MIPGLNEYNWWIFAIMFAVFFIGALFGGPSKDAEEIDDKFPDIDQTWPE